MTQSDIDPFADAATAPAPSASGIQRLVGLVDALKQAEEAEVKAEAALAEAKDRRRRLEELTIPEHMASLGQTECVLTDGRKVKVETKIHASISEAKKDEAFAWLRDNGHEGLIKREIKVQFGKGQDNIAGDVLAELKERGLAPESKETVPANSLAAWVREKNKEGAVLPLDTLGVFVSRKAVVK